MPFTFVTTCCTCELFFCYFVHDCSLLLCNLFHLIRSAFEIPLTKVHDLVLAHTELHLPSLCPPTHYPVAKSKYHLFQISPTFFGVIGIGYLVLCPILHVFNRSCK